MKKEDKEFLDGLGKVFEENQDDLEQAMKTLKENPREDGKVFSKELRDVLSPFSGKTPLECLKDKDFWRTIAKHGGISDEEIEEIMNTEPKKKQIEKDLIEFILKRKETAEEIFNALANETSKVCICFNIFIGNKKEDFILYMSACYDFWVTKQ